VVQSGWRGKTRIALREIVTNSPNPIIVHNPDGAIRYVNPAFEKLTGFSAGELLGTKPPFPWWPAEQLPQRSQAFLQNLTSDYSRIERIVRSKKGENRYVEITRNTVRDREGNRQYHISIWNDTTEQKNLQKNLEFYIGQVTRAQEEERKRIARELHDDTAQALAILGLEIESIGRNRNLSREDFPQVMEKLRNKVTQILDDVRRFSHELRPDLLDQLGLIMAVENIVEELGQSSRISASFEVIGDEHRLPADKELLIFRIIQESLNNIRKHSQATQVKVRIKFKPAKVLVMISDNGVGFAVSRVMSELASRGNMGLLGMQERVRQLSGHLTIKSSPGKGAMVFILIPEISPERDTIQAAAA
jgi:PAS domain S-box-containing protein